MPPTYVWFWQRIAILICIMLPTKLLVLFSAFLPQAISYWWDLGARMIELPASSSSRQSVEPTQTTFTLAQFLHCDGISLNETQWSQCKKEEKSMMAAIGQGVNAARYHCQNQFRYDRWNCTAPQGQRQPFGNIAKYATAETAYLYAITSAAVTYSLIRACAEHTMTLTCGCANNEKLSPTPSSNIEWISCSPDVERGVQLAKHFIDAAEETASGKGPSERQAINLHNNRVGRQAVEDSEETLCRCLGPKQTENCTYKACYKRLKSLSHVAAQLKSHYHRAVRVKYMYNKRSNKLRNWDANSYPFTSNDLVYSHRTTDLCDRHLHREILGIHGRECSTNVNHANYCNTFCCWYGYATYVENVEYGCNCRVIWEPLLQQKCDKCRREHTRHICK